MIRICIALSLFVSTTAACISQAKQAVAPEPPSGTGALSCKEIVEQCDSTCSDPFCIQRCSEQGNADGAAQHHALVDCGQRNSCTDQACMEASCPTEISACMGDAQPGEGGPSPGHGEPMPPVVEEPQPVPPS